MDSNTNFREDILPATDESEHSGGEYLPAAAGTFLQRRTHYFKETRTLLGALLSHSGVVIQLDNGAHMSLVR